MIKWIIIILFLAGCVKKKPEVDAAPVPRKDILSEEDLEELPETKWPDEKGTQEDLQIIK